LVIVQEGNVKRLVFVVAAVFVAVLLWGFMIQFASAGPVIIDGTDANDHGSVSGGQNINGWRYMQKALEELSNQVSTSTVKVVVDLGTTPDPNCAQPDARTAISSAFNLSSLPGQGWTLLHVDDAVNVQNWLNNLSISNTGILYIPTYGNLCGDLWTDEMDEINAHAAQIAAFVNGPGDPTKGGALFAMGERNSVPVVLRPRVLSERYLLNAPLSTNAYLWLKTIIPGIVVSPTIGGDFEPPITLTVAGATAFPMLTNADISAGPWHNWFGGYLGGLSVLAEGRDDLGITRTVILGGGPRTFFGPNLIAFKSGSLVGDADESGTITPGDTLGYAVSISNTGTAPISNVVYLDSLDPNTNLVVGSVQTTAGTVTTGNNPGDASVRVNIGTLSSGQGVNITYRATITNPMPVGVVTITNQGVVSSTDGTTPTNDPNHPGPTVITVTVPSAPGNLGLNVASDAPQCVLPGSSYHLTWTVSNLGTTTFPGGSLNTVVTGSGTGSPLTQTIGAIPTGTVTTLTETVQVLQPVPYGGETITVTGQVLTTTSVLTTHICAPDFRTSAATVVAQNVFVETELTYTWRISNTGDATGVGTHGVFTLPTITGTQYFNFITVTLVSSGVVTPDLANNRLLWSGNVPISGSVTVQFHAHTSFGFPQQTLDAPFEIDHPWRPPFLGVVTYIYPRKIFLILVVKDTTPSRVSR
jgi:uncharacterized repeat protein (TIGR01451 family)